MQKNHCSCDCSESDVYSELTEGHLLLHTTITEIPELQWEALCVCVWRETHREGPVRLQMLQCWGSANYEISMA